MLRPSVAAMHRDIDISYCYHQQGQHAVHWNVFPCKLGSCSLTKTRDCFFHLLTKSPRNQSVRTNQQILTQPNLSAQ